MTSNKEMHTMTDLERRALLGDQQAQEECSQRGILLPCPFCGNKHIRISNWGMWRCWCPECFGKSEDSLRERDAVKHWNTRPAPLVGRCSECGHSAVDLDYGKTWCNLTLGCREVKPDGFCNEFKPKEDKEK